MKKSIFFVLFAVLFLLASCSGGLRLYVSPEGNDGNAGTVSQPLQTLDGARKAVRAALKEHPGKGITVYFKGGTYPLMQAVCLTAEDSGSADAPVIYRAADGEMPVFSGSKALVKWTKLDDAQLLARLSPEVRGKIYVTDLAAAGITDFGSPIEEQKMKGEVYELGIPGQRPDLYCNGQRQTLARWPNAGFTHAGRAKGATELPQTYTGIPCMREGVFEYTDTRQDRWAQEADVRLGGYWYWDWSDEYQTVDQWDAAKRTVTLREPFHHYGYKDSLRYFGLNLFCEIDSPGEWYLDRTSGKLYWYPPENTDPAKAEVRLSCFGDPYMLRVENCSYVAFDGLTFCEGRGSGVLIQGGAHNLLSGCRIERFGRDGVHITGGVHHGVTGCYLSTFGHGGFKITGGDRKTLTPGEHYVEHTVVENFSLFQRTYEPAVHLTGCGIRIAHCRFRNSSSSAMRLEGNDFTVEYNEISSVVNESDDQGGIDMWYNPSYRGTVIRYNHWSDIVGGTREGAGGVRFDDMISGALVYGNLFERCGAGGFGGVQIHGGKDNRIENNVFYECNAGVTFSTWGEERWLRELDSDAIRKKIYSDVDINSQIYLQKYPELKDIRLNADQNTVTDNLMVSCRQMFRNLKDIHIVRNNTALDAAGRPASAFCTKEELAKYGLQPIPLGETGPKENRWIK